MTGLLKPKVLIFRVAIALALLLVVMLICSLLGSEKISLRNVFTDHPDGQINTDFEIFVHVRIPRIILAALV